MKKRALSMLLALLMALGLCLPAIAADEPFESKTPVQLATFPNNATDAADEPEVTAKSGTCGPSVNWSYSDDGTLTISGSGKMNNFTASNSATSWLDSYEDKILKIIIESGVTSIGNNVFWDCSDLTSVRIPDTVTTIGEAAFYGANSLTDITLPDSVSIIDDSAFAYCGNIFSLDLPSSLTSIGDGAFSNCDNLDNVVIPSSVTSIGLRCFDECIHLTTLTILNPNCEINYLDNVSTIAPSRTIIKGYSGSTAEKYAKEAGHQFVALGNESPSPTPTATPTPESTNSPEPTDSPAPTVSPTISPTPSPSPVPSVTPTPTPTPVPTATPVPAPTPEPDGIRPPEGGTGWRYLKETGKFYYFKDGVRRSNFWVGKADGASEWENIWYYAGDNGELLTGFQYLDNLKGGKDWYMLQEDNTNGTIGMMLSGYHETHTSAGLCYFDAGYGTQGACSWSKNWGTYDRASGIWWGDFQKHEGWPKDDSVQ